MIYQAGRGFAVVYRPCDAMGEVQDAEYLPLKVSEVMLRQKRFLARASRLPNPKCLARSEKLLWDFLFPKQPARFRFIPE